MHPQPASLPHNYRHKYYTAFAKSLRLRYMRVTGSSCKPHERQSKPSFLYRHMKFLPKANIETPMERYTGVGKLETYIENTKQELANHLPVLCSNNTRNLTSSQYTALTKLKNASQTLTIKPADKNLGIVLMNTDDYITQCLSRHSKNSSASKYTNTSSRAPSTHASPNSTVSPKCTRSLSTFHPCVLLFHNHPPHSPQVPVS